METGAVEGCNCACEPYQRAEPYEACAWPGHGWPASLRILDHRGRVLVEGVPHRICRQQAGCNRENRVACTLADRQIITAWERERAETRNPYFLVSCKSGLRRMVVCAADEKGGSLLLSLCPIFLDPECRTAVLKNLVDKSKPKLSSHEIIKDIPLLSQSLTKAYGKALKDLGALSPVWLNKKTASVSFVAVSYLWQLLCRNPQPGVMVLSPDRRNVYLNHRFHELFGFDKSELTGGAFLNAMYPDTDLRVRIIEVMQQVLLSRKKIKQPICHSLAGRDGQIHETSLTIGKLEHDELCFVYDSARQVNGKPERADLYRSIVESNLDAILGIDRNHRLVYWNKAAEDLFGSSAALVKGGDAACVVEQNSRERFKGLLKRACDLGDSACMQTLGPAGDAKQKMIDLRISPVKAVKGRISGASVIIRDIDEKKLFDQKISQAQKLESLSVVASGVAHNFNNLLQGIVGNAELAQVDIEPESEAQQYLKNIVLLGEQGGELSRQILAYSGMCNLGLGDLNINRLIKSMGGFFDAVVGGNGRLDLSLERGLPVVYGDFEQVSQLALNLVINAAEAGDGPDQVITVSTGVRRLDRAFIRQSSYDENQPEGLYVCLSVKDKGCGMPNEILPHIFDPFFTTKATGRGLGLTAVLGIVRALKGVIKVNTEFERGSTFSVFFPAGEGG